MIRFKLAVVLALLSTPVVAQESDASAQMAKATWSAFECSALAAKLKNTSEQERLFQFGYSQGKAFIAALQAGKITEEDLRTNAPAGVLLLLRGPSPDFMLGRIFEAAQDNALDELYRVGDQINSDEEQALAAANKFANRNCELIGNVHGN